VSTDTKYDVYLRGRLIDSVFYRGGSMAGAGVSEDVNTESVKRDLINHDGYDPAIVVVKARQ
jgi:hypothetical protein